MVSIILKPHSTAIKTCLHFHYVCQEKGLFHSCAHDSSSNSEVLFATSRLNLVAHWQLYRGEYFMLFRVLCSLHTQGTLFISLSCRGAVLTFRKEPLSRSQILHLDVPKFPLQNINKTKIWKQSETCWVYFRPKRSQQIWCLVKRY